ncbi:hypothetical protein R3P38DRAFT_2798466 [Favolaschia claudopus]|uniref:Ubiquitin-like protease family profile domain-containing protein n=1 Tax=Favolaschia claudopus TaxID=2862362 RepID=A0AAW0A1G7_9AGAR
MSGRALVTMLRALLDYPVHIVLFQCHLPDIQAVKSLRHPPPTSRNHQTPRKYIRSGMARRENIYLRCTYPEQHTVLSTLSFYMWNRAIAWTVQEREDEEIEEIEWRRRTVEFLSLLTGWTGRVGCGLPDLTYEHLAQVLGENMLANAVLDALMKAIDMFIVGDTFLLRCLAAGAAHDPSRFGYAAIQKYTHLLSLPPSSSRILIFPVYSPPLHWMACCVDMTAACIQFGDGFQMSSPEALSKELAEWVKPAIDMRQPVVTNDLLCAKQDDNVNCGIIAVNALAHRVLGDTLWTESSSRTHQYRAEYRAFCTIAEIILQYNQTSRSAPPCIPPTDPKESSGGVEGLTEEEIKDLMESTSQDPPPSLPAKRSRANAENESDLPAPKCRKEIPRPSPNNDPVAAASHASGSKGVFGKKVVVATPGKPKIPRTVQLEILDSLRTGGTSKSVRHDRVVAILIKHGYFRGSQRKLDNLRDDSINSVPDCERHVQVFAITSERVFKTLSRLTGAILPRIDYYIEHCPVTGAGAKEINFYVRDLFEATRGITSIRDSRLTAKEWQLAYQDQSLDRCWRIDTSPHHAAVVSTQCLHKITVHSQSEVDDPTVVCEPCHQLFMQREFRNTVNWNRDKPYDKLKYTPKIYSNPIQSRLMAKYKGLEGILNEDGELGVFARGVGMQDFKYPPAFRDFGALIRMSSPRTYRNIAQEFRMESERSIKIIWKATDIRPIILYASQWMTQSFYPPFIPFTTAREELTVATPEELERMMDMEHSPASKLRLWAIQIPFPGIPPLAFAILPISSKIKAPELVTHHMKALNGLLDHQYRFISNVTDGAAIKRDCQARVASKAKKLVYTIHPPPQFENIPALSIPLYDFEGNVFTNTQDAPHARKTGKNNVDSGARGLVLGDSVVYHKQLVDLAVAVEDPPLYDRDVIRADKQDDCAALRVFSAATLKKLMENTKDNMGLIVYLFVVVELIDAYESRPMTHAERAKAAIRARFFFHTWKLFLEKQALFSKASLKVSAQGYSFFDTSNDDSINFANLATFPTDQELCTLYGEAMEENNVLWSLLNVNTFALVNAPVVPLAPAPVDESINPEHLNEDDLAITEAAIVDLSIDDELQQALRAVQDVVGLRKAEEEEVDACAYAAAALVVDGLARIDDLPDLEDPELLEQSRNDIAAIIKMTPEVVESLFAGLKTSFGGSSTFTVASTTNPAPSPLLVADVTTSELQPLVDGTRREGSSELQGRVQATCDPHPDKVVEDGKARKKKNAEPTAAQVLARRVQAVIRNANARKATSGLNQKARTEQPDADTNNADMGTGTAGNAANAAAAAEVRATTRIVGYSSSQNNTQAAQVSD